MSEEAELYSGDDEPIGDAESSDDEQEVAVSADRSSKGEVRDDEFNDNEDDDDDEDDDEDKGGRMDEDTPGRRQQPEEEEEEASSSSSAAPTAPRTLSHPSFASPPTSLKGIRACLRCGLLKTFDLFYEHGCDNCPFLSLAESQDMVLRCTTSAYAGTLAVIDPTESWMSRYVHVGTGAKPGVYALAVTGAFDKEVFDMLVERGVKWRCRPVGFVAGK